MASREMKRRAAVLVAIFLLTTGAAPVPDSMPQVKISAADGSVKAVVKVEIADTPKKQEVGLMHRKHLDADSGMLFLFAKPNQQIFWMKDTEIPLDMIFIGSDMRVKGIVANARPFSWWPRAVWGVLTQYVLEVNGGFCARRGIKAGDQMTFSGFSLRASQ
jgi:uncharacterized membrane protein (UPF0127 family)